MAFKFKADVKKDVTASLKFKPSAYPDLNGLCLGKLVSVEVVKSESPKIKDDGTENTYQFAGLNVPALKFTFNNHVRKDDKDKAERIFIHVEKSIISVKNDGERMEDKDLENLYTQMWDRIKHIHDTYKNDVNYKAFKALPEVDPDAPADKLNEQFTDFFEAIATAFNSGKNDKPVFLGEEDKKLVVYMKLVAEYKQRRYLTFPTFVGEGFIERWKQGVPPTIELKPSDTQELKAKGAKASGESKGNAALTGLEDLPDELRSQIEDM